MDIQDNNNFKYISSCVTLGELREKLKDLPNDTLISVNSSFGLELLLFNNNHNLVLDFQEPI
jgi:hypothetical protein